MNRLFKLSAIFCCLSSAGIAYAGDAESSGWSYNIGAMYEIENVEGQGEDMDGLYEPSIYFNAAKDKWSITVAMYQEGAVDYSEQARGTYFNRPELNVRYQLVDNDKYSVGLTGGVRNYGYHFEDSDGNKDGTANTVRYKFQPDWNVNINQDWSFNGWLALFKFHNDLDESGYSDSRVETETGLKYKINDKVSLQTNYYLERAYNSDSDRENGEFSTQEMRIYLPIELDKNNTLTPYTRLTLDRWNNWDWQTDGGDLEEHNNNRLGMLYAHSFSNGLSMTLEYAHEWQEHKENGGDDKFHYAGVGVNYAF